MIISLSQINSVSQNHTKEMIWSMSKLTLAHFSKKKRKMLLDQYLREGIGCIGSCCGERSEEGGTTCRLHSMEYTLLSSYNMSCLSESTDKYKHIIHA